MRRRAGPAAEDFRLRICHVAPELLPVPPTKGGAIERWIRDAATTLASRGHDVHVIARDHGDGVRHRIIDGVSYHFVSLPVMIQSGRLAGILRGVWYFNAVRRLLRGIDADIVHHHSRPAGLWLATSRGSRARQVISLHSMDYGWGFGHRAWDRGLFARGLRAAARVLCVSNFIRHHTLERYPAVAATTTTLYNGVDGDLFHPEGAAPSTPTVLYVGRVEERKGVAVLVEAFERVISQAAPDARLLIVGPHSYWDAQPSGYYQKLVERCAGNARIELRGPTYADGELAAVYRSATVSVVPSVFPEALGLTSLEAQASGAPVVVSDSGGLPETVAPGQSGVVVPRSNAEALGRAVAELLVDDTRRRAMALAAREWAMATFSWQVIATELESVYREVAAPAAGAGA